MDLLKGFGLFAFGLFVIALDVFLYFVGVSLGGIGLGGAIPLSIIAVIGVVCLVGGVRQGRKSD